MESRNDCRKPLGPPTRNGWRIGSARVRAWAYAGTGYGYDSTRSWATFLRPTCAGESSS